MLGGLLLGLIEALGAGYVGDLTNLCHLAGLSTGSASAARRTATSSLFGSNYQDVFAFLVLIPVLVFRPSGLLGERVGRPAHERTVEKAARRSCGSGFGADRASRLAAAAVRARAGRHRVGAHHQPRDPLRPARARPQHRRRLRRAARSGLHRVLRGRRVRLRAAREPALRPAPAVLGRSCRSARRSLRSSACCSGAPTLKLRGDYLAIVTLGFGEIIRIFLNNLSQPVNITNGPQGITLIDPFRIGGFDFARHDTFAGLDVHRADQVLLPAAGRAARRRSSSICGCRTRASGAPGRRSARTRSPRARWASTRAT